jgi:hypothetical protein
MHAAGLAATNRVHSGLMLEIEAYWARGGELLGSGRVFRCREFAPSSFRRENHASAVYRKILA